MYGGDARDVYANAPAPKMMTHLTIDDAYYNRKQNEIEERTAKSHKAQEKIREAQERERDGYWEPMRAKQRKTQEEEPPPPKKRKADVFQRIFQAIVVIIRELWLERNMDRHQPIKGQHQIARIIETTRTVIDLYSLKSLIIPEHESKYFAMPLEDMVEQLAPRMLVWATRWKMGIYQSVRRAKLASKQMTVPI